MRKLVPILLTLSVIISSFGFLTLVSCAAPTATAQTTQESDEPAHASPAPDGSLRLDAGGKDFAMSLNLRQHEDGFDLRLILVENLPLVDHSSDLTVSFAFFVKDGNTFRADRKGEYPLPASGAGDGELKRYASIIADGKTYTAAENHALFGVAVNGIPYESFALLRASIKQNGKTLYEGEISYATIFSSDPAFRAATVTKTELPKMWMSFIADDTPVSRITVPGSHDSGARLEFEWSQTQTADITAQLEMGIRAFDIRCKVNNQNGFQIYHGMIQQPDTFDQVLEAYETFLTEHPSETVFMSMKQEDDSNSAFDSIMQSYMNKNPDLWYTKNAIPTLGEVRGKIILLSRYGGSSAPGIRLANGFSDNTTFNVNNGVSCRVQDHYNLGLKSDSALETKWKDIESMLTYANKTATKNTLCINFTSGYTDFVDITSISNYVNPKLKTYFESAKPGYYGLLLSDFVEGDLTRLIFMTNFQA